MPNVPGPRGQMAGRDNVRDVRGDGEDPVPRLTKDQALTLNRAALYLLAVLAIAGWLVVWWYAGRSEQVPDPEAERVLNAKGFFRATGPAVLPPGLPAGTKPIASIRGRVSFGPPATTDAPRGPGADNATASGPPPLDRDAPASGPPCSTWNVTASDLSGGCTAEIVDLAGRPLARLYWDGAVRIPDGRVVTRGPELADTIEFTWTPPPAPKRLMAGVDVGLVASQDALGWEIGGRVYPRAWAVGDRPVAGRVGLYGRFTSVTGQAQVAVGASVLVGR